MKYKSIVLLWMLLLSATATFAHNYHTSITDVKFNPRTQNLEVAVKVFTDDLQEALTRRNKRKVSYSNSEQVKQLLGSYLHTTLAFELEKGQPLKYSLLGSEEEDNAVWIYVEVPLKQNALSQLYVKNAMLMDVFADQMNIVNVEYKGQTESVLLQKGEALKKVSLN